MAHSPPAWITIPPPALSPHSRWAASHARSAACRRSARREQGEECSDHGRDPTVGVGRGTFPAKTITRPSRSARGWNVSDVPCRAADRDKESTQPGVAPDDTGRMKAQTDASALGTGYEDVESHAVEWEPVSLEETILAALDTPTLPGEQIAIAFQRKEIVVRTLFAQLDIRESIALHRRLVLMLPDDPIAARFGRLVSERRARLLAFLADARRRAALQAQRRT